VDSITHALIISVLFVLAGRPDLALYGVLGAVLIDVDVLFRFFSDRDPRLYIFTHGGFTHSFFGAFVVCLAAMIPAYFLSGFTGLVAPFGPLAIGAIVAGAATHVALDYLAYPGIPLLYPLSDKKYTLGIMGGPSAFIMLASFAYVAAMAVGLADIWRPWLYISFTGLVLAVSSGTKVFAAFKTRGRTIATMDPFKWMIIEDGPDAYRFYVYDFLKSPSVAESYVKFRGVTPEAAKKNDVLPEIRRLRYHSYIVTAEKDGDSIVYRDPIRENGRIWYPPYYKNYRVPGAQP
jgi:inner membrane protein